MREALLAHGLLMPSLVTPDSTRYTPMNNGRTFTLTFLASTARRALLLLGTLLVASALTACSQPVRQRKNVKDLTPQEMQDYVDAVLKLKSTPSPYDSRLSWYDQFVAFHKEVYYYRPCKPNEQCTCPEGDSTCPEDQTKTYQIGHQSPTFLPWHRKFLLMYEQALREVSGKDISLPYWDWSDEASTRAVFSASFMGPGGTEPDYAVPTGPFRKDAWEVKVFPHEGGLEANAEITIPYLIRKLGQESELQPIAMDMAMCQRVDAYDSSPWDNTVDRMQSFRGCLEGWGHDAKDNHLHNTAHMWVGGMFTQNGQSISGSMAALDTSPNDPVFFLHHANVDRLWALWEQQHGVSSYVPTQDGYAGWNPPDSLFPFNQYPEDPRVKLNGNTVGDMLDISKLGYEYR